MNQVKKDVLRMCVVCRQMKPKEQLVRVVITNDNLDYSIDGKKVNGRGAYVCKTHECLAKCIKTKAFNKAFKNNLPASLYDDLARVEVNE